MVAGTGPRFIQLLDILTRGDPITATVTPTTPATGPKALGKGADVPAAGPVVGLEVGVSVLEAGAVGRAVGLEGLPNDRGRGLVILVALVPDLDIEARDLLR